MYHLRVEIKSHIEEMETKSKEKKSKKKSKGEKKEDSLTEQIHFFSGNPSVEVTEGIIHLYIHRDDRPVVNGPEVNVPTLPKKRTQLVCVLRVPSYLSPSEFAAFTGAYHKEISHMRIITTTSKEHYTVIIKMKTQQSADEFYLEFNKKPFSSMEPTACTVLFIASVEFIKQKENTILFPPEGQTELPTCAVCLERLDETANGILTILCNHSFHCHCLSQWKGDGGCPVCRYCQQPEPEGPNCAVCGTNESLWICLICGNIGCGRYKNEHARLHYKETMHVYALELQTSRVWDYMDDRYVHRLVQNKSDGKLVELPPPGSEVDPSSLPDISKVESISLEYTYLLEAQKAYFVDQIRRMERQKHDKINQLEEEFALLLQQKEENERKARELEDEKKKWDKRVTELEKKMKETLKETDFLKNVNNAMSQSQEEWKEKVKQTEKKLEDDSKDKKIQELQDQIKDLMYYIEARNKIEQNEELQNGDVILQPTLVTPKRKVKKKK